MKIRKTSVFYRVFTLTLSNIGLQILGFLYRIFLSRMTGAEGMGVYQLVLPYYSVIMAFTVSGLTMAVSRLSAQYAALGDMLCARRVVRKSLALFLLLFAVVATPILLYSGPLSETVIGDMRTRLSLLLILPCLLCTGIENILKNYFFGTGNLKPPIISELTEQSVRFAAVAILLIAFLPQEAGQSSALIVSGMIVSEIGSVILLSVFYRKRAPKEKKERKCCVPVGEITAIAAPVALSALLNNLLAFLNSVLIPQRLVASGMAKSAAISSFGVLFGMTLPLLALPIALISALTVVIVPNMSAGAARGMRANLRRKAGKMIQTTSLLALPAIGVFLPLGREMCVLLFHDPHAGAYMLPLCVGTLFSYYQISTTALLNAIGLQRRAAGIIVLGGIVQLLGTWLVGVPEIGMAGFLWGDILSALLMAVLNFIPLLRRLKLKIRWRNWFFTPALASVLAGLCARLVHEYAKGDGLGAACSIMLALGTATLVYLLTLRAQGTSLFSYLTRLKKPQ